MSSVHSMISTAKFGETRISPDGVRYCTKKMRFIASELPLHGLQEVT